jgi:Fumarase C C-terminus
LAVNVDQCRMTAENSLALSTVVAAVYGYEAGARTASHAVKHGTTIKCAALELGIVSERDAEELFDPLLLADSHHSSRLLERKAAEHRAASAALCASLPEDTRKAIFAAAVAVAQADETVSEAEAEALQVITEILDLDLSVGDAAQLLRGGKAGSSLGSLSAHGGEISYACAMWIAMVASTMGPAETRVLAMLRELLDVGRGTAELISNHIAEMAAERAQHLATHEEMPWWENFAALLTWILTSWTQHPAASSAEAV